MSVGNCFGTGLRACIEAERLHMAQQAASYLEASYLLQVCNEHVELSWTCGVWILEEGLRTVMASGHLPKIHGSYMAINSWSTDTSA